MEPPNRFEFCSLSKAQISPDFSAVYMAPLMLIVFYNQALNWHKNAFPN